MNGIEFIILAFMLVFFGILSGVFVFVSLLLIGQRINKDGWYAEWGGTHET